MYDDLEATLHDVFWAAEGACAELPLLEKFLQDFPGTGLELGCGSGRLLEPLLKKGYFMEGLDSSAEMLALCSTDAVLHHAGMEDFQTGSLYGAITIPAFTLQLLDPEKIPDVFSNIRRHLHPGGGLYLTTFIPWAEIVGELEAGEWFLDQEVTTPDGNTARCHTRFSIQRLSQKLVREHRYEVLSADGTLLDGSTSTHHLTWFWPEEMQRLLRDAGFSVVERIGDFSPGAAWNEDSQIITHIARACEPDDA